MWADNHKYRWNIVFFFLLAVFFSDTHARVEDLFPESFSIRYGSGKYSSFLSSGSACIQISRSEHSGDIEWIAKVVEGRFVFRTKKQENITITFRYTVKAESSGKLIKAFCTSNPTAQGTELHPLDVIHHGYIDLWKHIIPCQHFELQLWLQRSASYLKVTINQNDTRPRLRPRAMGKGKSLRIARRSMLGLEVIESLIACNPIDKLHTINLIQGLGNILCMTPRAEGAFLGKHSDICERQRHYADGRKNRILTFLCCNEHNKNIVANRPYYLFRNNYKGSVDLQAQEYEQLDKVLMFLTTDTPMKAELKAGAFFLFMSEITRLAGMASFLEGAGLTAEQLHEPVEDISVKRASVPCQPAVPFHAGSQPLPRKANPKPGLPIAMVRPVQSLDQGKQPPPSLTMASPADIKSSEEGACLTDDPVIVEVLSAPHPKGFIGSLESHIEQPPFSAYPAMWEYKPPSGTSCWSDIPKKDAMTHEASGW